MDATGAGNRERYASKKTRDELLHHGQLTAKQLKDILLKVLPGAKGRKSLNLPTEEAIKHLAAVLNHWHRQYYTSQEGRNRNALLAKAENALKALDEIVPKIIEFRRFETEADPFARWQLKAAENVAEFLGDLQNRAYFLHREGSFEIVQGWQWLIPVLPIDFVNAMKSTNPNFEAGLNQNGPLSRYISAVIPFVTGDHPKTESVAGAIRSHRKKNLSV